MSLFVPKINKKIFYISVAFKIILKHSCACSKIFELKFAYLKNRKFFCKNIHLDLQSTFNQIFNNFFYVRKFSNLSLTNFKVEKSHICCKTND